LVSYTKGRTHIEDVQKRVLKRTFRPKRKEVVGGRRTLQNGQLRNPGVDGKITSEWILGKCVGKLCAGCISLRIGTIGGLL